MAYNATIPQATDRISVSQADILNNFAEINTFTAIDHVAFGIADAGKHKTITMPEAVAPGAVGAAEVGLYVAALSGSPELYVNKTGTQIPCTAALKASPGWTFLPSGMKLQWGTATLSTPGTIVPFNTAFANACVSVQLTARWIGAITNDFLLAESLTVNNFTGYCTARSGSASTAEVYYFAIGY